MKLIAYAVSEDAVTIRPAPVRRRWMDITTDRRAYQCLPMTMANRYGWELLCPSAFLATWDGGPLPSAIHIETDARNWRPTSSFGDGAFSIGSGYVFQTEGPVFLYITGPTNSVKHGIVPLSGIIESDWFPLPLDSVWAFTQPGEVKFEKEEPFCQVFLLDPTMIERIEAEIRPLQDNIELAQQLLNWSGPRAMQKREEWTRRLYADGVHPCGVVGSTHHRRTVSVPPFRDNRHPGKP